MPHAESTKNVNVNFRVNPELRDRFRQTVELTGESQSDIFRNLMTLFIEHPRVQTLARTPE